MTGPMVYGKRRLYSIQLARACPGEEKLSE